jgi:hypothetical protein
MLQRHEIDIKIDWSGEYENISDLIHVCRKFDSNLIDESDLQNEQHFNPRVSIFLGVKIDW